MMNIVDCFIYFINFFRVNAGNAVFLQEPHVIHENLRHG